MKGVTMRMITMQKPWKTVKNLDGSISEEHYKFVLVEEALGYGEIVPQERHMSDKSVIFFQNISPDADIYVKWKNGITLEVRYIDVDHEKGVFTCTSYPSLRASSKEVIRDEFIESIVRRNLFDGLMEAEAVASKFIPKTDNNGEKAARFLHFSEEEYKDREFEIKKFIRSLTYYREYDFISVEDINDDKFFMLENENAMILIGDPTVRFPEAADHDIVESGVAITIRDSKNPTKTYYTNILGKVVAVPVKNDNRASDGITIVKTFKGKEEVERHNLSELQSLGIFTNIGDAEANCDTKTRIDLLRAEAEMSSVDKDARAKEIQLEINEIKLALETEKQKHEKEKMEYERAIREYEKKIEKQKRKEEKQKREHEKLLRKHEATSLEVKKAVEEARARSTVHKSNADTTSSVWKTVGAVVAGVVSIALAVFKFFF